MRPTVPCCVVEGGARLRRGEVVTEHRLHLAVGARETAAKAPAIAGLQRDRRRDRHLARRQRAAHGDDAAGVKLLGHLEVGDEVGDGVK